METVVTAALWLIWLAVIGVLVYLAIGNWRTRIK